MVALAKNITNAAVLAVAIPTGGAISDSPLITNSPPPIDSHGETDRNHQLAGTTIHP